MASRVAEAAHGTEHRAIVDTHRHPIGPKLAAKMAEAGLYDPKKEFPQTNPQDLMCYREFFDLEYAMPKQREGGVTLSLASNGGEVDVLPSPAERQQVFWKTSNRVFRLGLVDTDLVTL
jgi:hypothetical protein